MSNDVVGKLYANVIDGVVDDSRADFEDNGVDEVTLQELKSLWQQKLTRLAVARMPWDPAPVAAVPKLEPTGYEGSNGSTESKPYIPTGTSAGSGTGTGTAGNTSVVGGGANSAGSGAGSGVYIKREMDYSSNVPASLQLNPGTAAFRAAQNIQQFAQENQDTILAGVDETVRGIMNKGGVDVNGGDSSGTRSTTGNGNGNVNVNGKTSDGSNDGGLVLPGRGTLSQMDGAAETITLSRSEIDALIKQRAERKNNGEITEEEEASTIELMIPKRLLQNDGAVEDEGINSDLDDSEDELNFGDEEEDDDQGMIMLCLYDKVQRVKNKWKYVLKDGVANVNGKDYVFSKASGESEW